MSLLLLVFILPIMLISLNHGIKKKERLLEEKERLQKEKQNSKTANKDLDESLSALDYELAKMNERKPQKGAIQIQQEKDAMLQDSYHKGIITFDDYLKQSLNQYPDNREEFNRKP